MANFDEVTEKAKEIFDGVSQKTGEFVSIQKLRITAGDIKSKISKLYKKLGELVYASRTDLTDYSDEIDSVIEEINDKKDALKDVQAKIDELKNKRSCPSCGKTNDKDAVFCSACGEKISYSSVDDDLDIGEIVEEESETSDEE
jgi:hypothetical protein